MEKLSKAIDNFWERLDNINLINEINSEEKYNDIQKLSKFNKVIALNSLNDLEQSKDLGHLEREFYKLALSYINGGHIELKFNEATIYKIYTDTVEFYIHCEGYRREDELNIKDPIMYHRNNGKLGLKDVPYLPVMTLNAHGSGYDITFENPHSKYRASALIRKYTITNGEDELIYRECTSKGKEGQFEPILRDHRSTLLYDILNGFPLTRDNGSSVLWIDDSIEYNMKLKVSSRANVFISSDEEKYKRTNLKDLRPWQFNICQDRKEIKDKKGK